MKNRAAYFIFCIFLVPLTAIGQSLEFDQTSDRGSITAVELIRNIMLEEDSKTEEVLLEIQQKTQNLELEITSEVSRGKVTIEVYDPKGTKLGYYSVGTLLNSEKREVVNGNIRKSFVEPQSGKWKIKIIPIDATGRIRITTGSRI